MEQPASPGSPAEQSPKRSSDLRRAVYGSVVGTALEWYDFFIYGTAAVTVFDELFFAGSDPAVGRLGALATFGVGFLFRPLGGFLVGRIGDRIGRRSTLVITTLVMGLSTGVIGLLPTYQQIGLFAPLFLTLLRICQGLGAGAEFGGASTLLSEHAPAERRGFLRIVRADRCADRPRPGQPRVPVGRSVARRRPVHVGMAGSRSC